MGAQQQGADATQSRWLTIPRTLCFVLNGNDVLLMKRSPTRRVFPNLYNGLGGHIERNEDPFSSAAREIKEESGLDVINMRLCGVHNIDAGAATGILMFVFRAESTSRDFVNSSTEGTLHWIDHNNVMTLDLVEDIPYILPRVLNWKPDTSTYFAHVSYNTADIIQLRFSDEV